MVRNPSAAELFAGAVVGRRADNPAPAVATVGNRARLFVACAPAETLGRRLGALVAAPAALAGRLGCTDSDVCWRLAWPGLAWLAHELGVFGNNTGMCRSGFAHLFRAVRLVDAAATGVLDHFCWFGLVWFWFGFVWFCLVLSNLFYNVAKMYCNHHIYTYMLF